MCLFVWKSLYLITFQILGKDDPICNTNCNGTRYANISFPSPTPFLCFVFFFPPLLPSLRFLPFPLTQLLFLALSLTLTCTNVGSLEYLIDTNANLLDVFSALNAGKKEFGKQRKFSIFLTQVGYDWSIEPMSLEYVFVKLLQEDENSL